MQKTGMFRTLEYSELWYIQNLKHIHNFLEHLWESITKILQIIFCTIFQYGKLHLSETTGTKIELVFSILAYSDIIKHIHELSRDIQAHSEASVTPIYSEPWYIQDLSIFRTPDY